MSGENTYTHGVWSVVVKKYDPIDGLYLKLKHKSGFKCDLADAIKSGSLNDNGDEIQIPQDVFGWLLTINDVANDWAFS